jgi:hypothetical protein
MSSSLTPASNTFLQVGQVQVWIAIDDRPIGVYQIREEKHKITCFIESIEGKVRARNETNALRCCTCSMDRLLRCTGGTWRKTKRYERPRLSTWMVFGFRIVYLQRTTRISRVFAGIALPQPLGNRECSCRSRSFVAHVLGSFQFAPLKTTGSIS